eukprot:TRINITY_DN20_c0_g1_i3.p1 TRINITY_DN20_c0_g1~~TRINITY_DN20_c0_g1_i3.p1  ORF type:complete len:339 (+),score=84.55 TRINITY_DN20_c0_g1_i3:1850-2866(+)
MPLKCCGLNMEQQILQLQHTVPRSALLLRHRRSCHRQQAPSRSDTACIRTRQHLNSRLDTAERCHHTSTNYLPAQQRQHAHRVAKAELYAIAQAQDYTSTPYFKTIFPQDYTATPHFSTDVPAQQRQHAHRVAEDQLYAVARAIRGGVDRTSTPYFNTDLPAQQRQHAHRVAEDELYAVAHAVRGGVAMAVLQHQTSTQYFNTDLPAQQRQHAHRVAENQLYAVAHAVRGGVDHTSTPSFNTDLTHETAAARASRRRGMSCTSIPYFNTDIPAQQRQHAHRVAEDELYAVAHAVRGGVGGGEPPLLRRRRRLPALFALAPLAIVLWRRVAVARSKWFA